MILTRRILPFLVPLILAGLLYGILDDSEHWLQLTGGIALTIVLSILIMLNWEWKTKEFFGLLFPYFVGVAGGLGYLLFLERLALQYLTIALIAILSGVYLENVFTYRFQPKKYTQFSIPNFSVFLLTLAGFCLFSAGFGLVLTNVLPYRTMVWFSTVFAFAMMLFLIWGYQIPKGKRLAAVLLPTILLTELVWILQYWPTAFFVNGVIIAVFLYAVPTLIQLQLRELMTRTLWIQYAVVGGIALLTATITAQWN